MIFATTFIRRWEDLFLETGNPLFAWRAYQAARRLKEDVPETVLRYLDNAAGDIIDLANDPPAAKNRPIEIAQALGLAKKGAGSGGPFKDYTDNARDFRMAIDAFWEVKDTGKDYLAFLIVGEKYHVSESNVRRNYLEHMARWHQTTKAYMDSGCLEFGENGKAQMTTIGDADMLRETAIILHLIDKYLESNPTEAKTIP
jgi:hypothetical protein